MKGFLNSLRFQLFAVLVALALFLAVALLLNLQAVVDASEQQQITNQAGNQRANAYLLSSLLHRYEQAEGNDRDRASILGLIDSTIARVRQIQAGLRNGDSELNLKAVHQHGELIALLDDTDREWNNYLQLIDEFMKNEASQTEANHAETRQADLLLIDHIESQSVAVYTYANRLVNGFSLDLNQELQASQQFIFGLIGLILLTLSLAAFTLVRSARAVGRLSSVAQSLAAANFKVRADTGTVTEIARVGTAFNYMAERISQLIDDLGDQIDIAEAARQAADEARLVAERSDQVKSSFLASMSHELRTPLNAVINFTKFVAQGDLGPVNDEQRETLYEAVDSARHLLNLINDVLDMSKIESGSLTLFVQDNVNVQEILTGSVSTAHTLLDGRGIEIREKIPADLPGIRGDKQRIRQIVLNIISNACKFTDDGFIEIRAEFRNDEFVLAVQDTGPGIDPEDQAAVFEPFRQTSSGLRKASGTGLGMPISKNLAEIHGGRLWFESEPGKGSTFFVALPAKSDKLVPVHMNMK